MEQVWTNSPPEWLKRGTKVAVLNNVNQWELGTIEDINDLYIGVSKIQDWGNNQWRHALCYYTHAPPTHIVHPNHPSYCLPEVSGPGSQAIDGRPEQIALFGF